MEESNNSNQRPLSTSSTNSIKINNSRSASISLEENMSASTPKSDIEFNENFRNSATKNKKRLTISFDHAPIVSSISDSTLGGKESDSEQELKRGDDILFCPPLAGTPAAAALQG